jgi:arsenite methyltransferase
MDRERIRDIIRRRYAAVAAAPEGEFPYPVGRGSAERLRYPADFMAHISADVIRRFVGVGNPYSIDEPDTGFRVVDVGCGAGFDSQVAAFYIGPAGRVVGVDVSSEMLAVARAGLSVSGLQNVTFVSGCAEDLPVESGWADLVISNGVLNLAACKTSAFSEIARILRPGGRFQAADLILVRDLPEDLRNDQFAWSN